MMTMPIANVSLASTISIGGDISMVRIQEYILSDGMRDGTTRGIRSQHGMTLGFTTLGSMASMTHGITLADMLGTTHVTTTITTSIIPFMYLLEA